MPNPVVAVVDNIPTTDITSTIVDLVPHLDDTQLRRAVIEALRLKKTTISMLERELPRRKGAPRLRALLHDLADLPIAGTKSNAEGQALYRLKRAGRTIPETNKFVAGHEVDQVDFEKREITEIDGPGFHADTALDAKKTRDWENDGFTVNRRPSDDAYDDTAGW